MCLFIIAKLCQLVTKSEQDSFQLCVFFSSVMAEQLLLCVQTSYSSNLLLYADRKLSG